ncbi:MAG TPA: hypothetical protein VF713_16295, partial [Thermoanaerobaculia bacterium]
MGQWQDPEELRDPDEKRVRHGIAGFVQPFHFFVYASELLPLKPETVATGAVVKDDRGVDVEVDFTHPDIGIARTVDRPVFIL